jgi:6-phosphogluconolactonase (cycloisomerase 2 family)
LVAPWRWKFSRILVVLLALAIPTVAGVVTYVGYVEEGVDGVEGISGIASLDVSRDGANLYAVGPFEGTLAVFSRNQADGSLEFLEVHENGVGGIYGMGTPSYVAVSPDGRHVYVTSHLDDALVVFSRDLPTGLLTYVETYEDGAGGIFGLQGAWAVTVSPDNKHVLVTGYEDESLVVFNRHATLDDLQFVDVEINGVMGVEMRGPAGISLSPDSSFVYVSAYDGGYLSVFRMDATQEEMAVRPATQDDIVYVGWLETRSTPIESVVDRTGSTAYVVGGSWLMGGARNIVDGAISFQQEFVDGEGGIDGLQGAYDVAINRIGGNVMVVGAGEDSVAVFSRDQVDGSLEPQTVFWNGVDGVAGIRFPVAAAVSPDSRFLYVAGSDSDSIAIFEIEVPEMVFTDGFENGDLLAWSAHTNEE